MSVYLTLLRLKGRCLILETTDKKFCSACDEFFRCVAGLKVDCPLRHMKVREKMKQSVKVGQKIKLRLRLACSSFYTEQKVRCTVLECYDKFCVLTNGRYRFCAFYDELYEGARITA